MTAPASPSDAQPSPEEQIMALLRDGGDAGAEESFRDDRPPPRRHEARGEDGRYASQDDAPPDRLPPVLDFGDDADGPLRREPETVEARRPAPREEESREADQEPEEERQEARGEEGREGREGDDEEPTGPQMLSEIADEYEVKPEEFLDTIHIQGPDGQPVALADVVRTYQDAPQLVETRVAGERQRLEQARRQFEQESGQRLQQIQALHQELEALVLADGEPNWKQLQEDSPERYAEERIRWANRQEALRKVKGELEQEYARRAQGQQEDLHTFAQQQAQILVQRRPEWRDPQRRLAAMRQVDRYLRQEIGFSDEQLEAPLDARMVEVAWEASEYRRLKKASKLSEKRMRRLARSAKPGARRDDGGREGAGRSRRIAQKSAALRRTGSDEAAMSLLEEFV